MTTVSFQFKPGVCEEKQEAALAHIGRLEGVSKVARLLPGSTDPVVKRICNVYVRPGADPAAVVRQVQDLPEVEYAEQPPPRYLV